MKAEHFPMTLLRNDAHFQFMPEFRALVERYGAMQLKFNSFLPLYEDAHAVRYTLQIYIKRCCQKGNGNKISPAPKNKF